jgi:hypothetical protein
MSRYRLIEAFEQETVLPIDLNEARKWLLKEKIQEEIEFVPTELNPEGVIRGFVRRYKAHRGGWSIEPIRVSDIYYDTRQSIEWQNMVCAKELLHILDGACIGDKDKFEALTQRLSLPNDVQHMLEDPDFAFVDKVGTVPASALLLPLAAREVLLPPYKKGVLTAADIAGQAVMPVEHVRTVMSDIWPRVYEIIKKDFGAATTSSSEEADDDGSEQQAAE